MLNASRIGLVIVLTIYLMGAYFMLDAIGNDLVLEYQSTTQSIGMPIEFLGMSFTVFGGIFGNILVSVSMLPLWMNTLFIIVPSILLPVLVILMFIPTMPSG